MTFLHIAFFAGSVLIAAPIIMHLIMRQQPRHLEFPALRFIKQREDANRRRLRFRHILLLLLRCAVICLLATALTRPSIHASGMLGDQEAPVAAALVFDSSPRMAYRQQNQSRLEVAQETALWLLEQLPRESDVGVLTGSAGAAVFAVDMGAAKQRIKKLDTKAVGEPLMLACEEALRLVAESDKERKEVYVFTDLARASWSGSAVQTLQQRLKESSGVSLYIIDVGADKPRNYGLADVRLSNQVLTKNASLRLQTELIASGPAGERTVDLFLLEAGQPVKRNSETVKFGENESAEVEFRVGALEAGLQQGYLKITGEDGLACDDIRYFTVETKPAWKVLVAAPPNPADYALFLTEALAPHDIRLKGQAAFDCEVVGLDQRGARKLADYSAVCILDPTPLPAVTWQKLAAYAATGGGVGIFLGNNCKPVESFNEPAAQELLPGKLTRVWRAADQEIFLAPDHLQHPLLAKFRPVANSTPWDAFPVFRHWGIDPLADGASVVIAYSNNQPALLEKPLGKGRVVTMTTPISDPASRRDTWNILPTGDEPWPFLMLANETLYYLVGSGETRLNYIAGATAVLRLAPDQVRATFSLTKPNGDTINQSADESQSALLVTATDEPGNYRAQAGGSADGVKLGFSVNLPPEVSQFQRVDDAELKAVFGETPFRLAHNREEIDRSVSLSRVGQELYPYFILLLALCLAAEQALSNRFYRHDSAAPGRNSTVATTAAQTKEPESVSALAP